MNPRSVFFYLLVVFFLLAGINHFRDPDFYLPLIPPWIPFKGIVNMVSGIAEMVLAVGLLIPSTRRIASHGLVLLLLLFIPSHVYMIQENGCIDGGLCIPLWVAHMRLWVIHPLLIYWIWRFRNYDRNTNSYS